MPHKSLHSPRKPISPDISKSVSSLFHSSFDNCTLDHKRRTSISLSNLSPGKTKRNSIKKGEEQYDPISIQDLMGGEKKATDIHSSMSGGFASPGTHSVECSPRVVPAEDKIHSILQARKTRQRRRSDISKSLESNISPMMDIKNTRASFSGLPDGLQHLTIPLNDMGASSPQDPATEGAVPTREGGRRRRRNSLTKGICPSGLKGGASREQRLRAIKKIDQEESSHSTKKKGLVNKLSAFSPKPKSPGMRRSGSTNALRDKLRKRLQGVNYCDLNGESTHSSEFMADRSRSSNELLSSDDDDLTADTAEEFGGCDIDESNKALRDRSNKNRRSRSKSSNRTSRSEPQEPETESPSGDKDDSMKNPRSKSKNRIRSKSKQKRRSSMKGSSDVTEDESGITSKSNSTRGSKQRRRSSMKGSCEITEDETSVNTYKSNSTYDSTSLNGRRAGGRRPKNLSNHNADYNVVSDDNTTDAEDVSDAQMQSTSGSSKSLKSPRRRARRRVSLSRGSMDTSNSSIEDGSHSPESKKEKKRSKVKRRASIDNSATSASSVEQEPTSAPDQSLGFLLDSERSKIRSAESNEALSQVTEEQSKASSYAEQAVLLQFDPTGANHVQRVNQKQARRTSEVIEYGLHGETSNLEIAELAGLPTFEKLNTSGSTGTTQEESLTDSSHDDSNKLTKVSSFNMFSPSSLKTPVKNNGKFQRSASMLSPTSPPFMQSAGEDPFEAGFSPQNASWDTFGAAPCQTPNSDRQSRRIGKIMGFGGSSKHKNRDELETPATPKVRLDKPMRRSSDLGARRSSDLGARTSSFGAMMGLRARYKQRGHDDGESLLQH